MTYKTAAISSGRVLIEIYNWAPSTSFPRVTGDWVERDQCLWQAAEKEPSEGPAAANLPTIVKVLFPSSLHIFCQRLHYFVSENTKQLPLYASVNIFLRNIYTVSQILMFL